MAMNALGSPKQSVSETLLTGMFDASNSSAHDGFRDLMQLLHGANGPFRTSTRRTPEMHVHFLTSDIAIMHSRFWIAGEVIKNDSGRRLQKARACSE